MPITVIGERVTLYTLTSVCIFFLLFSIYFLRKCHRELVQKSRASLVGDHFPYSHELPVWINSDTVGEIRSQSLSGIKGLTILNEIKVNFCQALSRFLKCNSVAVWIVVLHALEYWGLMHPQKVPKWLVIRIICLYKINNLLFYVTNYNRITSLVGVGCGPSLVLAF